MLSRSLKLLIRDEEHVPLYKGTHSFSGSASEIIARLERFEGNSALMCGGLSRHMLVPLSSIVGTAHSEYCDMYSKNEDGVFFSPYDYFPGKRSHPGAGVEHGWFPRDIHAPMVDVVSLKRHPSVDKFCVSCNGNHRVMASKLAPDGPQYVYARVWLAEWCEEIKFVLYLLSLGFDSYRFDIDASRTRFARDWLVFSVRESRSSRWIFSSLTHWQDDVLNHSNLPLLLAFARRRPVVTRIPSLEAWLTATSAFIPRANVPYTR